MAIKPIGLTGEDIMRAVLAAQGHDPWHDRDPNRWLWHASELARCPRRLIYNRAAITNERPDLRPDPTPLKGAMLPLLGSMYHERMERAWPILQTLGKVEPVVIEHGYIHPDLPLASRPDALLRINGELVLMDYKTEDERACQYRERDAREMERRSTIKPDHELQLAATALVLQANGFTPINQAFALYMSKNSFWISDPHEAHVDLSDGLLFREVERRVRFLEAAWADYVRQSELPDRIDNGDRKRNWECRPVGWRSPEPVTGPGPGSYCPSRSVCRG